MTQLIRLKSCLLACLCVVCAVVAAPSVSVGEIRFRKSATASSGVIRLGDLAEIHTGDPRIEESLSNIELFPAPAPGTKRTIRVREVQERLHLRGVSFAEHLLTGSSVIEVNAPAIASSSKPDVSTAAGRRASELVKTAIIQHLRETASTHTPWQAELTLDEEQMRLVLQPGATIAAACVGPVHEGACMFQITVRTKEDAQTFAAEATISTQPLVVVAKHVVPRGAILSAADLELRPGAPGEGFSRIEEVVHLEAKRGLAAGQPITRDAVVSPLMVKRGDVVTVYVRSAGLQVKTNARAREDGSMGDMISVESLANRKTYLGRVTGPQQLEVSLAAELAPQASLPPASAGLLPSERGR